MKPLIHKDREDTVLGLPNHLNMYNTNTKITNYSFEFLAKYSK